MGIPPAPQPLQLPPTNTPQPATPTLTTNRRPRPTSTIAYRSRPQPLAASALRFQPPIRSHPLTWIAGWGMWRSSASRLRFHSTASTPGRLGISGMGIVIVAAAMDQSKADCCTATRGGVTRSRGVCCVRCARPAGEEPPVVCEKERGQLAPCDLRVDTVWSVGAVNMGLWPSMRAIRAALRPSPLAAWAKPSI